MGAATTANRFLARGHTVHYRDRDHHKEIARGLLHRHKLHKRKRRLERAGLLISGGGTKGKGKRRRYSAYSYGQYDQAGSRPRWGQQDDRRGEAPGNIQKARVKFEVVKQGAPPRPKAAAQVEGAHRLTQEEGDVEFDAAVVQQAPQGLSRHSLSTEGEHAMGFGGGFGGKGMKSEGKYHGGKHPHHDDHVTPQFLNAYPIISLGYPLVQVIVFYSNNPGPDDEFYMDRTLRPNAVNAWRDVTCLTAENPTPRGCPAFKDQRDDFMRFFLYALHHTDSGHLFGNIVLECLFGPPLECAHGNPRFLALVLLGVFGGSLAVAAVNPTKIVVGSSGYAYAVLFMHLGNLVLNWNELGLLPGVKLLPVQLRKRVDTSHYSRCTKFKLTGEVPRNIFTAIVVGAVIFLQVVGSVQAEIDGAPMSHAAHVGGGLFGLLASFLFVKNLVPESMEQMFVVVAGTLLFVIFLVLSIHIWTGQSAGDGGPDSILELAPWECTCCDDGVNYCALTTTSSTAAPADDSRMLLRNLYEHAVGLGN
eukprot:g11259.t1